MARTKLPWIVKALLGKCTQQKALDEISIDRDTDGTPVVGGNRVLTMPKPANACED